MARRRNKRPKLDPLVLKDLKDPATAYLGTNVGAATATATALTLTSPLWVEGVAMMIQRFVKAVADGWGGLIPNPLPDLSDKDKQMMREWGIDYTDPLWYIKGSIPAWWIYNYFQAPRLGREPDPPHTVPTPEIKEQGLDPAPAGYEWVRMRMPDGSFEYKLLKKGKVFTW